MEMTPQEYQEKAHAFARYGNNINYPLLGLAEECGEVAGKVAKFIRKHEGVDPFEAGGWVSMANDRLQFNADLAKELGDVLWMVAEIATAFDLSLDEIMQTNIDKLTDRNNRGVIVGEGDNR